MTNRNWRWNTVTHLFADDLNELHAFAARIGLKRSWFQVGRSMRGPFAHYDLTPGKYRRALAAGAVQLTRKTFREAYAGAIKASALLQIPVSSPAVAAEAAMAESAQSRHYRDDPVSSQ
jgi:hypothetical protein